MLPVDGALSLALFGVNIYGTIRDRERKRKF